MTWLAYFYAPISSDAMPASADLDLNFRPIGPTPPRGFDCGREEQNEFLHNRACTYHELRVAATHLAYHGDDCVGFVTLATDSILLDQGERPDGVRIPKLPAIKIAQLGVDVGWKRRGIGKDLVAFALLTARSVRGQVGCVYLSVDAKPDGIEFYEKLGFKRNKAEVRQRKGREGDRYNPGTASVSMRFDIRDAGEV